MELTIQEAMQRAMAAHKQSKLQEAERIYRAVLQSQPKHPDANHNLGVIAISLNKTEAALPLFKTALDVNPNIEQFWLSYIEALVKAKRLKDAKRTIKQAKKRGFDAKKLATILSQPKDKSDSRVPSQQQLSSLLAHYQNGRFDDAESLATSITQEFPTHQFAWKVLGAVCMQTGKVADSLTAMQKAAQLAPEDAEAHYNLGNTLQTLGKLNEAEASYKQAIALNADLAEAHCNLGVTLKELERPNEAEASLKRAIALRPGDATAHNNLGITLKKLSRLDEAEASYKQAIASKPDYPEIHNNLGNTLKELDRLDEAEASYKQAITLKPDYVEAYNNVGSMLKESGRLDEAEASFRQAIALKSDNAEIHNNLGSTLNELGRLNEAEASYRQAIALKPDFASAHYNMGNSLQRGRRWHEAEASFRQAIRLTPELAEAHCGLGLTLQRAGRLDEAEASYKQAITLKPDYVEAYNNVGLMLQEAGRLHEAKTSFMQAIALKPDFAEAHRHLTLVKTFDTQDDQYSTMLELYRDSSISDEQRCHINFGLAKACEDLEHFEQAFTHYSEGNQLRKKLVGYDIHRDAALFEQIKSNYARIEQISLQPDTLSKNPTPIFIVGMPRSGTTLIEQIISSHSKVTGAGELSYVTEFGGSIANGFSDVNAEALLAFREQYLEQLKNHSDGNPMVTDKMPQNFRYLGLLATAFPEAKLIHVKRTPAAICWANYKTFFIAENLSYSHALEDIVRYYGLYENLMAFWAEELGDRIYTLDYERLTHNQESETRQLIDYLGVDWDDNCLSPQDNTRAVATASNRQVRHKVYRGSSEEWKKYEPFLNSAFDDLLSPSSFPQPKDKSDSSVPSQQQLSSLLAHYQNGRFDDAESLATSITQEFPAHQFAWKVLGTVCMQTGKVAASLIAMQKAAQLAPEDAEAHNSLGGTLQALGRLNEAEASYRQAIALKPDYAEAHNNVGNTLQTLGKLNEAEASYRQAIALKPDFAAAHYNMGSSLQKGRRWHEAEASLRRAIDLKPDYAEAHNNLGLTLQRAGRLDEAEASYKQAITLKPDYVEAYNNVGLMLQEAGRLHEAKTSFMQAIALKPDFAEAHRHLTLVKTFDTQDDQYSTMLELYRDSSISDEQRCHINFGLAKACEDLEHFEQAFTHYSEGNQLRKKLVGYDIHRDAALFEQIKSNYARIEQISLQPDTLSKNPTPIFIVGMPRSGTTLIEQIISSHSKVTGAGELSYVTEFGGSIANGFSDVNAEALLAFREQYLEQLKNHSDGNPMVTDKMPHNFRYLGLLATAFPEAKLIHVKRTPAAICWANYKTFFAENLSYSHALEDIVRYYGLYENLMAFWAEELGDRIYTLDYERLTHNQESETRQLIDYLGVDWDDNCLSPQDNTRAVATASNLQVRHKVYRGSSEEWKKYEPFLNSAFDDLLSPSSFPQPKDKSDSSVPSQQQLSSLLAHYQNGRFDDAESLATSITQEFPAHQFAWKVLGTVCMQTGKVAASLIAMQKAAQLAPEDAEAHNSLGGTLQALGKLNEAEASYRQAITLKPDYAEAHSNLGTTLKKLGRLNEAEVGYKQAITLKPEFFAAHNNLGITLTELGRFGEAEDSLRHAIALKPDYAEAHNNLGLTLQRAGRLDEAEASFRLAISLKPNSTDSH